MNDATFQSEQGPLLWLALCFAGSAALLVGINGWWGGFHSAQAISGVLPHWLWESLTTLGDERILLALMLPFCQRYPRVFWAIVMASLIGALACRGIKFWAEMPRPAAILGVDEMTLIGARLTRHSFPSGHTVSAFCFAAVWLGLLGWQRCWPILLLAVVAGFSRIAVGAHWPVDVLFGAAIAFLAAWAGLALSNVFRWGLRSSAHWALVGLAALAVATLPFDGQGYPGSLPFRLAICAWGLAGFYAHYLAAILRHGWEGARRPAAMAWAAATKP